MNTVPFLDNDKTKYSNFTAYPPIDGREPIWLPPANIDVLMSLMQVGEGIVIIVDREDHSKKEKCKRIYLHAFSGARDIVSVMQFKASMEMHKRAGTNGPSGDECLLYTGHVGISFETKSPIYGFNPDTGDLPGWLVIERLKEKAGAYEPYPGVVTDDTSVFNKAKALNLKYKILEYIYPEKEFNELKQLLKSHDCIRGLHTVFRDKEGIVIVLPGRQN